MTSWLSQRVWMTSKQRCCARASATRADQTFFSFGSDFIEQLLVHLVNISATVFQNSCTATLSLFSTLQFPYGQPFPVDHLTSAVGMRQLVEEARRKEQRIAHWRFSQPHKYVRTKHTSKFHAIRRKKCTTICARAVDCKNSWLASGSRSRDRSTPSDRHSCQMTATAARIVGPRFTR